MPVLWPRNIIPYDENNLRALSTAEAVALHMSALEGPLHEPSLSQGEREVADRLVKGGILARDGDRLVPVNRHRRDPDTDTNIPGHMEHKRAKTEFVATVATDTFAALKAKGTRAHAAIGVVTLPDTPETIAEATGILAEAEDQLRALAETAAPDHGETVRVLIFVASAPSPATRAS